MSDDPSGTPAGRPDDLGVRAWWQGVAADVAARTGEPKVAGDLLQAFAAGPAAAFPVPGSGRTVERYDGLRALGEADLTVGRLAEAHLDALAICAELGAGPLPQGSVWAVWAAEPPTARVDAGRDGERWRLTGRKAWCSGAGIVSHALVTAHAEDGPRLFAVDLSDPTARPVDDPWPALALSGTDTRSVDFDATPAMPVGSAGEYVGRPGFWHGAAGVAAVWLGGATAIAGALFAAARRRSLGDIDLAHLGAVAAALSAGGASLERAARAFDADPRNQAGAAEATARSARAVVEAAATEAIDRVGRALGPAPLAFDVAHARRVSDLQLYLRQSHADRDLAALGRAIVEIDRLP